MRNMRMRMRIENLIHIIHIWIFAKNGNFLGQKWVSLALFSILSAQNIIIVHTSWFYPSSGMKIKSPKSQNFGQEKMIFFTIDAVYAHWCASDAHRCASASIGAWPTLIWICPMDIFHADIDPVSQKNYARLNHNFAMRLDICVHWRTFEFDQNQKKVTKTRPIKKHPQRQTEWHRQWQWQCDYDNSTK